MYSLDEIKENYRGFSDSKVENIAKNESKGLRKEVLSILKDEIKRRNLNISLISWVDTETKSFDGDERRVLLKKIQEQHCPKCSGKNILYGFETNTVKSFLIGTSFIKDEVILCRSCGKQAKLNAILITFFAGWWSGKGFLSTPFIILKDTVNFLFINKISHRILNSSVDRTTGSFRRYGTTDSVIIRLINWKNNSV
ncbi:hypothetical protein [Winogradskyella flava]|uniref:hypothetical protein n=1 Tax=Winogradskyella flava TaxID=1884876 RepID=UPI002491963E|nr:hypothetical protein [Winogradskyella flava]